MDIFCMFIYNTYRFLPHYRGKQRDVRKVNKALVSISKDLDLMSWSEQGIVSLCSIEKLCLQSFDFGNTGSCRPFLPADFSHSCWEWQSMPPKCAHYINWFPDTEILTRN
jgi:hypothetical protein